MPLLLTHGDQSPPMFTAVVERLQAAAPGAERRLFDGAGHPVDLTHPAEYAAAIEEFAGTR
ncbi:MAG TPA: alpha/beta hydrolase [Solirubrobacterales bacterium]|nr:alpha/beta hydrolase [Solirubrobacterales bacterium]